MALWFDPPVSVTREKPSLTIIISSVERAAEQLLTWEERGPKWHMALVACMAAMEGSETADNARAAFEEAAREGGRLLDPPPIG